PRSAAPGPDRPAGGGGASVRRKAVSASIWSSDGSGPCIVFRADLRTCSFSEGMLPSHAYGGGSPTPSSDRVLLGAPYEPSPKVSASRPLLWPSVWQLWQLIQPSCDSRAS